MVLGDESSALGSEGGLHFFDVHAGSPGYRHALNRTGPAGPEANPLQFQTGALRVGTGYRASPKFGA